MRKRFVLDTNKCTGCGACRIACINENDTGYDMNWRNITSFNNPLHPEMSRYHLSLACNHCGDPPCANYCPSDAYYWNEELGTLHIDQEKCIGCKFCNWVCPYDAPKFNDKSSVMEKCTFCSHRLEEGLEPACAAACPVDALGIEDNDDEELVNNLAGFPEEGIQPSIRIINPGEDTRKPADGSLRDKEADPDTFWDSLYPLAKKLTLTGEWSLILFTLLVPYLTAILTAYLGAPSRIVAPMFIGAGVAGLLVSTFHLGKAGRFYKAMYNWKKSWLTLEIMTFILFLALSAAYLFTFPHINFFGGIAALTGIVCLFFIDNIYRTIKRQGIYKLHSADVLFTGFYVAGIASENEMIVAIFAAIKLFLYVHRKFDFIERRQPSRPVLSIIRLSTGFLIPLMLRLTIPETYFWYAAVSVYIGELIDRSEFYLELELMKPQRKVNEDIKGMITGMKKAV